jgi:hypothetical protein
MVQRVTNRVFSRTSGPGPADSRCQSEGSKGHLSQWLSSARTFKKKSSRYQSVVQFGVKQYDGHTDLSKSIVCNQL